MAKRIFCGLLILMLLAGMTACSQKKEPNLGTAGDSGFREDASSDLPAEDVPADAPTQSETPGESNPSVPQQGGGEPSGNEKPQSGSAPSGNAGETNPSPTEKPTAPVDPTAHRDYSKNNPLIAEEKPVNRTDLAAIHTDSTGFVKNVKMDDLKEKTIILVTASGTPNFIHGDALDEWTWLDSLKESYGLSVKRIESNSDKAPQQIITYMNAGKSLDGYLTHRGGFPQYLTLSAPLDPYIDMQYKDNSPGVDLRTMEQTKWDGTYRAIAPKGAVDVIWYNETMTAQLKLPDPHLLWEQGKWDWNAWKDFLRAVPKPTPNKQMRLCPWSQSEDDAWIYWARTNGVDVFGIKTTGGKSTLQDNFSDLRALEAWNFYATTVKGVDYANRQTTAPQNDMYRYGSCIMSSTAELMVDCSRYTYAKNQKFNWVPYPKGTDQSGTALAMNSGITMMLPKKTKATANRPYAVKFMELWATRFTEAMNDYLQAPQYDFSYAERKEYFDFAAQNSYFPVGTATFRVMTGSEFDQYKKFKESFYNSNYETADQAHALYPMVKRTIEANMTWMNY